MKEESKNNAINRASLVKYWMEKAHESLSSAGSEFKAGRLTFTVNRIYYACFYAVSAVLIQEGKSFRKHSGVRAALHRELIKTGKIGGHWGRYYNRIFDSRHRGDYMAMIEFDALQVSNFLKQAKEFLKEMEGSINK